ncbi:uncharacterized protein LOC128262943 [Drosophila gunungcola]|uniref:DUF4777 domain-containing protein n=1 Tax=Drosophila gunungcola TaxID=103775 RepID=A0A9P9YRW8_9MUSC|nr:uncharacterized protein LOC128262943 [Drosophila gunungcola]KAI8041941.1 hypothetical protein M5D96_003237 [Drosophila gunungcola]
MPNFNGAIIVHTLQLLNSPATLREIIVTIAKNTELPQDELKAPVKQTLDMGHRMGYLQKLDGRYFLVPMTFDTLRTEMHALDREEMLEKPKIAKSKKKLVQKSPLLSEVEKKISKKTVKSAESLGNPIATKQIRKLGTPSLSSKYAD